MALGLGSVAGAAKVVLSVDDRDLNRGLDRSDRRFRKSVDDIERDTKRAHRSFGLLHTGMKAALIGVGVAVAGLALGFKSAYQEMTQAQKAAAQTAAVIKSTGGAANVTAGHVTKLSEALLKKTGIDDEVIQAGENMLLTFRNVRNEVGKNNDIFDQATKIGLDMSTALQGAGFEGGSLQTTMIRLGKALNDPVQGMTALRRVGVTFTKDQQELIKHLEDTGHHLEAQKLILAELRAEFAGSAEAYGKTLPGQLTILREGFKNLEAGILTLALPAFIKLTQFLSGTVFPQLENFGKFLSKVFGQHTFSAKVKVAAEGIAQTGKDLAEGINAALFGSRETIAAGSTGYLTIFHDGLLQKIMGWDWSRIGQQVGRGISRTLTFTSEGLDKLLASSLTWVSHNVDKLAEVGVEIVGAMFLKLTDPVFWANHWQLALSIAIVAFGGSIGRAAGRIGSIVAERFGISFSRALQAVTLRLIVWSEGLPNVITKGLDAMVGAAYRFLAGQARRIFEPLESEAAKLPQLLARVFRLGVVLTALRAMIDGVKSLWNGFVSWMEEHSLRLIRAILEPWTHLPAFLGGWARKAKDRVNSELDNIEAERFAARMERTAARVADTAPLIAQTAHVAAALARALKSVPSDTTVRFIVKTLQFTPGQSPRGGDFQGGGHAGGGRIPGQRVAADSVPAMLSPGEFVVTGGGERMLEAMTFPGVLDWLGRKQPRHFAEGGRVGHMEKLIQYIRQYSAPLAPGGGAVSSRGLVPQVQRAIGYAAARGWSPATITSGFRTYGEQAALYARYLAGGPLAARPGTSSHEFGQAIDTSDYGRFGGIMAGAPASSRLFNFLGAADPVHFSVSGYQGGGRVKRPRYSAVSRRRTGEVTIDRLMDQVDSLTLSRQNQERNLDLKQQELAVDDTDIVKEVTDPVTGETRQVIDPAAQANQAEDARVIIALSKRIEAVTKRIQALMRRIVRAARAASARLTGSIGGHRDQIADLRKKIAGAQQRLKGTKNKQQRKRIQAEIAGYQRRIDSLQGIVRNESERRATVTGLLEGPSGFPQQLREEGFTAREEALATGGFEKNLYSILHPLLQPPSGGGAGGGAGGADQDLQAQLDQAQRRAQVSAEEARLANAFVGTGVFAGGGLGQSITINSQWPPTPEQVRGYAAAAAEGAALQPYRTSSVEKVGF